MVGLDQSPQIRGLGLIGKIFQGPHNLVAKLILQQVSDSLAVSVKQSAIKCNKRQLNLPRALSHLKNSPKYNELEN